MDIEQETTTGANHPAPLSQSLSPIREVHHHIKRHSRIKARIRAGQLEDIAYLQVDRRAACQASSLIQHRLRAIDTSDLVTLLQQSQRSASGASTDIDDVATADKTLNDVDFQSILQIVGARVLDHTSRVPSHHIRILPCVGFPTN